MPGSKFPQGRGRLESEPTHEPGPPMWFFIAATVVIGLASLAVIGVIVWAIVRVVLALT